MDEVGDCYLMTSGGGGAKRWCKPKLEAGSEDSIRGLTDSQECHVTRDAKKEFNVYALNKNNSRVEYFMNSIVFRFYSHNTWPLSARNLG